MINFDGQTILIVDDESELRELYCDEFLRLGGKILEASNGVEGFDIFQKQAIDVIVTDYRMMGGSGLELIEKVKNFSKKKKPVIVFVSGDDLNKDEIYAKGADGILVKPFAMETLTQCVFKLLASSK